MSPKSRKNQIRPDWNALKEQATRRGAEVAKDEICTLRNRLKDLFPGGVPVTIQLFQPIDGGRLVDVGPRPQDASDSLVFQGNAVGRTGDIFQDAQAAHRFIPLSKKVGEIRPGTFPKEILELEKLRHPGIGEWTNDGPPHTSWIHQLPLASLPQTLGPRENDEQYRFANLGAVYTMSRDQTLVKNDGRNLLQRLILYALRSGEIAQQVRFEHLCGGDNGAPNPTEGRVLVTKCLPISTWSDRECEIEEIAPEWKTNVDGGLCRLVGTLILHHHWWYAYDPIGYELLCELTSQEYAQRIYHLHLCCAPEYTRKQNEWRQRSLPQMLTVLSEDITQIISSYRNSDLDMQERQRVHGAVATMIRQFCGEKSRRYCRLETDGKQLAVGASLARYSEKGNAEVNFLDCRRDWGNELIRAISHGSFNSPIIRSSTLKDKRASSLDYCQFALSLLSPNASPLKQPSRSFRTTDQRTSNGRHISCHDPNGDQEHFLYWHTRAMLKIGPDLQELEELYDTASR